MLALWRVRYPAFQRSSGVSSVRISFTLLVCVSVFGFAGAARVAADGENGHYAGIAELKTSPNGRFIATADHNGELAVLDLDHPGALPIYSRALEGGFAWSPDSKRLAFCERFPSSPVLLWTLQAGLDRDPAPLVSGFDWKAGPAWLNNRRVLYLSDRDSDHVNLWVADTETTETLKLLDRGRDISGVWVAPHGNEFVYRCAESGEPELWFWWDAAQAPIQLTRDPQGKTHFENFISFAPAGRTIAFVSESLGATELVAFDITRHLELGRLPVTFTPDSLVLVSPEEAVVAADGSFYRWEIEADGGSLSRPEDWNGAPVSHPASRGERGWAASVNGELVLTFDTMKSIEDARVHARTPDDLIRLARRLELNGHGRKARSLLADLWDSQSFSAEDGFRIAAMRAWLERKRGSERRAHQWLREAGHRARPGTYEANELWHARLMLTFFDDGDADEARRLIDAMPEDARGHPRVEWIRSLLQLDDRGLRNDWRKAGLAIRRGEWREAAEQVREFIASDPTYSLHREGVALILHGDFEPLDELLASAPVRYSELLNEFRFQEALIELSARDLTESITKKDLRDILLAHWAQDGKHEWARNLVLADLRDLDGSTFDYEDVLTRFLDPEEQEGWLLRSVHQIFLDPQVVPLLDRQMSDTRSHVIFSLARAKGAFIQDDVDQLGDVLAQLDRDFLIIPPSFWTPTTARFQMLMHLFRAKYFERKQQWDQALLGYSRCFLIINRYNIDWGILPFDLAVARETIERGQADTDLLRTYFQTLRGFGDPLVNPSHDPVTIRAGLTNLHTLRAFAPDAWARPLIEYQEGNALVVLGRPYRAIDLFRHARTLDPPRYLLARAMIDEAAVRSSLAQHGLAASLMEQMCGLGLEPPQLATAIRMRAQTERAAGLIESEEDRMRYLCRELRLPREWAATLIPDHTVLPLEDAEHASDGEAVLNASSEPDVEEQLSTEQE